MKKFLCAAVLGGLIALAAARILYPSAPTSSPVVEQKTAFERVTTSGILRCAYAAYDPFLIMGASGSKTGIFYDVLEEAAKRLNLKVEWTEEVGYGNINTGFVTGRYDAFCAGLWPAGSRAANTIFSRAVVWDPVSVWGRADDNRFDGNMKKLNDPVYKVSNIDGDATASMVDAFFPKATRVTVSQNQTIGEEILQVTTGKSDALFIDYISADKFLQNTPGSLKDFSPGKPPLVYALTVGFNQHETALRDMFDVALNDMDRDGTIERIVKTYLGDKSNLLFQQKPQFEPYEGGK